MKILVPQLGQFKNGVFCLYPVSFSGLCCLFVFPSALAFALLVAVSFVFLSCADNLQPGFTRSPQDALKRNQEL